MIEKEIQYKNHLREVRGLAVGTTNSYPTYLNAVSNHLNIDITSESINSIESINGILNELEKTGIDKNYWGNCQSALRAYLDFLNNQEKYTVVFPDEVDEFREGSVKKIQVNIYERDSKARTACISYHKPICKVCGFDFHKKYGDIGKGFIHIHHVVPLSDVGKEYKPDPINDLVPVCPNCHAMLHTRKPPLSVAELKELMNV